MKFSTHLMEYLKDPLDTGQTEDGSFNFKSIKEYRGSYSLSDPEHLGKATIYLLNGTLGRKLGNLQTTPWQISTLGEISKQDFWLMDISPRSQLKLITQELFHCGTSDCLCSLLNLTISNGGEQMMKMHTFKHSQNKSCAL